MNNTIENDKPKILFFLEDIIRNKSLENPKIASHLIDVISLCVTHGGLDDKTMPRYYYKFFKEHENYYLHLFLYFVNVVYYQNKTIYGTLKEEPDSSDVNYNNYTNFIESVNYKRVIELLSKNTSVTGGKYGRCNRQESKNKIRNNKCKTRCNRNHKRYCIRSSKNKKNKMVKFKTRKLKRKRYI